MKRLQQVYKKRLKKIIFNPFIENVLTNFEKNFIFKRIFILLKPLNTSYGFKQNLVGIHHYCDRHCLHQIRFLRKLQNDF